MKSPTKKETLFASVFFTAKAYTLRTEGREKEELKKEGGVGGACVCVGGGGVVTFLNQGNTKVYRHLSSILKQNPVDFYTDELPVQFNARFYLQCKYTPFLEEFFFQAF